METALSAYWDQKKKAFLRRKRRARRRAAGTLKPKSWCRVYAVHNHEGRTVYIGQTRLEIAGRMRWHRKAKDTRLARWMRDEKSAGREYRVVVLEENGTWDVSEIIWIERARVSGEPLLNMTRGGKDPYRHKTIETAEFIWDDATSWP